MNFIKPTLIVLLVIGVILGIKFIFFPSKKDKKQVAAPAAPSMTAVTVFIPEKSDQRDKLYATGSILAFEQADLHPETSGKIEYLNMPEGRAVKKGLLLLKINDKDIKAQLNKVRSQLKLAQGNLSRQRKLLDIEGASQQEYEQAQAELEALKSDSAFYEAQISKTEIRAPFSGVLGIREVSMGTYVTPASVVAAISQINPVRIDFFLPEKYAALLAVGEIISCNIEGTTQNFKASISVKDPQIDIANRSVRFRALSPNKDGLLMPGAFVRIEINLKGNENSLFIPTESAIATLKGKKVFVIKNGKAEEREIETGLRTSQYIQVISGLNKGDSVIVSGNYQLKPGAGVKVLPVPKPVKS